MELPHVGFLGPVIIIIIFFFLLLLFSLYYYILLYYWLVSGCIISDLPIASPFLTNFKHIFQTLCESLVRLKSLVTPSPLLVFF